MRRALMRKVFVEMCDCSFSSREVGSYGRQHVFRLDEPLEGLEDKGERGSTNGAVDALFTLVDFCPLSSILLVIMGLGEKPTALSSSRAISIL